MPQQAPKRGALPSPRSTLAAAVPYATVVGAPPTLMLLPQALPRQGAGPNAPLGV
jgi:hypothetical protein